MSSRNMSLHMNMWFLDSYNCDKNDDKRVYSLVRKLAHNKLDNLEHRLFDK